MIRLIDGYAIDVDKHCYTVGIPKKQTIVNKKTGESKETEVMTSATYYSTLDQTLRGWWRVMRKKELENFEGTLEEALEKVRKLDERVIAVIDKVKIETVQN